MYPMVSIVIPTHNEEKFIEKCLKSFLKSTYPEDRIELIVVDGMSEDGTRSIVKDLSLKDRRVVLVDNEEKITPVALNLGIKASKGDYVLFSGAHSEMPADYVSKCVTHALETGADNVGGVMLTRPRKCTAVGIAIARVLSSTLGVGGAKFRTGVDKPTEVDTVPFGCYKRGVFDRIGMFSEKLVRNQDIEFNLRLKRAGGKIMLFPDIEFTYYARSTYRGLCKNSFGNGFWVVAASKYAYVPFSFRHLIPFLFTLFLIFGTILALFIDWIRPAYLIILSIYIFLVFLFSCTISAKANNPRIFAASLFAYVLLHISYGIGSLFGLIASLARLEVKS